MPGNLANAERLRDELERQWAAHGVISIHGRRLVFSVMQGEPHPPSGDAPQADFFLAIGTDLDGDGHILDRLRQTGLPILGARGDVSGKPSDDIISIRAGRDQVIDTLLRLAGPTTTVVIDAAFRGERVLPSETISPVDSIPPNSTRLVLAVGAAQARSFVRANQPVLKGRTVIVPSDKMSGYPDLVASGYRRDRGKASGRLVRSRRLCLSSRHGPGRSPCHCRPSANPHATPRSR
jgi:hypothetical protein